MSFVSDLPDAFPVAGLNVTGFLKKYMRLKRLPEFVNLWLTASFSLIHSGAAY